MSDRRAPVGSRLLRPRRRDVRDVGLAGFERVVRRVRVGDDRNMIRSARSGQVSPLKSPAQLSLRTRTISSSLRADSIVYGPLPTISLVLVRVAGLEGRLGHREERLEAGHGREVGVRRRQRDRQRHRLVVGDDSGDRVGLTGEAFGAALDEVEQVAVVASEVGDPLPRTLERARQDRLAVGELLALLDRERPHRGVLVGFERLGEQRDDLRVLRIAHVDLRQPVIQCVDDLVGVHRRVERRVDVLGWTADERAAVDDLSTSAGRFGGGGVTDERHGQHPHSHKCGCEPTAPLLVQGANPPWFSLAATPPHSSCAYDDDVVGAGG